MWCVPENSPVVFISGTFQSKVWFLSVQQSLLGLSSKLLSSFPLGLCKISHPLYMVASCLLCEDLLLFIVSLISTSSVCFLLVLLLEKITIASSHVTQSSLFQAGNFCLNQMLFKWKLCRMFEEASCPSPKLWQCWCMFCELEGKGIAFRRQGVNFCMGIGLISVLLSLARKNSKLWLPFYFFSFLLLRTGLIFY